MRTLAGRAIDLWQGSHRRRRSSNAPFVRAFMQGIPAAERGNLIGPDGQLSKAGAQRVQSAVVAHAYGDQLGPTLDRFVNDEAEGLKNVAGALTDAAGAWAQMRSEASKGFIPAPLDITPDLAHAVQIVDRARQTGRPVPELLAQADLDRPVSPLTSDLVRGFYRDEAMRQPAGRETVAERLKAYAEVAARTPAANDMFGQPPPPPAEVLKAASVRLAQRKLSTRDAAAAHAATMRDPDVRDLPPEAIEARDRLRTAAVAMMRFLGLPERVGLKLVEKIVAGEHGADGAYTRGLIELALDTKPDLLPAKLFHESVHALMDLDVLTPGQKETLRLAAKSWLRDPRNRAFIEARYGKDPSLVLEEAIARMGEVAFRKGQHIVAQPPAVRLYGRLLNAVRGIGQVLRGQGYATAQDVFRGVLRGERALPGSREALMAAGPQAAPVAVPEASAESTPQPAPSNDPTGLLAAGAVPERYLALRDERGSPWLELHRGENVTNRNGSFYSPDREFARNFTQSGRDAEIRRRFLHRDDVHSPEPAVYAGDERGVDRAIAEARALGKKAVRVTEGAGNPDSIFVLDKGALRPTRPQYALRPGPQTETPEFRRWFSGSRVVDGEGKPLVVYHGTKGDVSAFDGLKGKGRGLTDAPKWATFFSSNADLAGSYAKRHGKGANVIPAHLALERPLVVDAGGNGYHWIESPIEGRAWSDRYSQEIGIEKGQGVDINTLVRLAKKAGHDGLIVHNVADPARPSDWKRKQTTYVAFRPEQIKSAIGNRGTFDPSDPRILRQARRAPPVRQGRPRARGPGRAARRRARRAGRVAAPGRCAARGRRPRRSRPTSCRCSTA
jgi:hypothetical protein